jgi:hypothetical protein
MKGRHIISAATADLVRHKKKCINSEVGDLKLPSECRGKKKSFKK